MNRAAGLFPAVRITGRPEFLSINPVTGTAVPAGASVTEPFAGLACADRSVFFCSVRDGTFPVCMSFGPDSVAGGVATTGTSVAPAVYPVRESPVMISMMCRCHRFMI